jgi:MFS family permease
MRGRGSAAIAPLRRPAFRLLWIGWSISYAGDALQLLAQTWLIAVLTGSALAVAGTPALAALPLVLLPLGGVISDAYDRRRLLLVAQLAGAAGSGAIAVLVATHRVAVWQLYAWIVFASLLRVVARPTYKVLLTEVVPAREKRPAMALSSMTETGSMVLVTGLGALFLSVAGLTAAFVANALTYVVAAAALWQHRRLGARERPPGLSARRAVADLRGGFGYLRRNRALFEPLVLTFLFVLGTSPLFSLLAAVVHAEGRSLVDLGVLAAATSLGTFLGAGYAGARPPGGDVPLRYAQLGLVGAAALAAFALEPVSRLALVPLVVVGAIYGAQTVWNASRAAEVGDAVFQGRLQAITTMALGLGSALAALWAGPVLDVFGVRGLLGAASGLALASTVAAFSASRRLGRVRAVPALHGESRAAP